MSGVLQLMDGLHVIFCIPKKALGEANGHASEFNELRSSEIDKIWKVFNILLLKGRKKACSIRDLATRISLNWLEPILKRWDGVCWRGIPFWRWAGRWVVWLQRSSSEWPIPSQRLEVMYHYESEHLFHPLWRFSLFSYCHFKAAFFVLYWTLAAPSILSSSGTSVIVATPLA